MAITGNPGDLATGGFGTGISGQAATARDVAAAVDRGAAMAADRQGGAGGLLGNAMRAGGFAGAAMPAARPASYANQLAVSRGAGTLGQLGSTPLAPNDAQVAMQKAAILGAALRAQYGNAGLLGGGIDALARTIAGEAAGETPLGQTAVAQTMLNRMALAASDPAYGYLDKLSQYSAYTDKNKPFQAAMPGTESYNNSLQAIANAMNPNNALPASVQNATHYYANVGPNAINAPSWAKGQNFTQLGSHTFGLASELSPSNVASLLGNAPAAPAIPGSGYRPTAAQIADAAVTAVRQPATRPVSITPAASVSAAPTQVADGVPFNYPSRVHTATPSSLQQWAHSLLGTSNYGTGGPQPSNPDRNDEYAMAMLDAGARRRGDVPTPEADSGQSYFHRRGKGYEPATIDTPQVTTPTVPQWWTDWYNTYGKTGGILA